MNESEVKIQSASEQKAKIRERYKGVDEALLEVIPALSQTSFYDDTAEKRIGVYARVSTDNPNQTSSYELQKNYYYDFVSHHSNWKLVDIYADEGISGTSLQHRDAFIRMINDCQSGKIDMIITKSVSRFARNVLDCIGYIRKLKAMTPPVGVFFETENLYTLNDDSEMGLSFISTLAQEESHNKSKIMDISIEMRNQQGIFLTPTLLGYDHDEYGNLIINKEEAKTVRLIFFMYLYGYRSSKIAAILTKLNRPTKLGNTTWSASSVLSILQNERHCGDILARKTYTPNYLNHRSKKNKQNKNQYRQENHHEAIISRDDFMAVQSLIRNAKYRHSGFLPELTVIPNGALKGYVSVNPRWSGFKAEHYRKASASILAPAIEQPTTMVTVHKGDFDLRGFEIVRSQFFNTAKKITVTFSPNNFYFSTECIKKLDTQFVEMLINPKSLLLVLRPAVKEIKNAVQWSKPLNGNLTPRIIGGTAFLPTLYELFEWDITYKYRITGTKRQNQKEEIIVFNLKDTEILIPDSAIQNQTDKKKTLFEKFDTNVEPFRMQHSLIAYPENWAGTFGNTYYEQSHSDEKLTFTNTAEWHSCLSGNLYNPKPLRTTSLSDIKTEINTLIAEMNQGVQNEHQRK